MSQANVLPRQRSSFSIGSRSSRKSSLKAPNTPDKEKMNPRIQGKADPTKAIQEEEPFAVSQSSNYSIRTLQHKDQFGNVIEPDRSNPTRSRWERPLDTIRSFENAIDNSNKRKSYARPEHLESSQARQSYYAAPYSSSRFGSQVDFHRGRPPMSRPDSWVHDAHQGHLNHPYNQNMRGNRSNGRLNAEMIPYGHPSSSRPSPPPHQEAYGSSFDGSQSTDAWGNSTNPSSDNGSANDYWGNSQNRPGRHEGRYESSPSRLGYEARSSGPVSEYSGQHDEITPVGPSFKGKLPSHGGNSPLASQGPWSSNPSPIEPRIDPWGNQGQHSQQRHHPSLPAPPPPQHSQQLHVPSPPLHQQQRQRQPSPPQHQYQPYQQQPLQPIQQQQPQHQLPPPPPHAQNQYGFDFAPVQNYNLGQNPLPAPPKDMPRTLSKNQYGGMGSRPPVTEKKKSWFKRLSTRA